MLTAHCQSSVTWLRSATKKAGNFLYSRWHVSTDMKRAEWIFGDKCLFLP